MASFKDFAITGDSFTRLYHVECDEEIEPAIVRMTSVLSNTAAEQVVMDAFVHCRLFRVDRPIIDNIDHDDHHDHHDDDDDDYARDSLYCLVTRYDELIVESGCSIPDKIADGIMCTARYNASTYNRC